MPDRNPTDQLPGARRPSVVMTSLDARDANLKGMHAYVTACAAQAQIALIHLERVWRREGADTQSSAWDTVVDSAEVWADLQGAMAAGITLSRLLKPTGVRARPPLTRQESVSRSESRGRRLRELLGVDETSELLSISAVRDPLEHIDERMDRKVEDSTVVSISDFYIAQELYFDEMDDRPGAREEAVHANMRTFVPSLGILLYGSARVDLFAFEARLRSLLEAVSSARQAIEKQREVDEKAFGSSRPLRVNPASVVARRAELARMRRNSQHSSFLGTALLPDPRSVVLALGAHVEDALSGDER